VKKTKDISEIAPPQHIAIIMDGNGRWAKKKLLPKFMGHKRGADAAYATLEHAAQLGVPYLTLYAFSSENWERPKKEVHDIMGLFKTYIRKKSVILDKYQIKIKFPGDRSMVPTDLKDLLDEMEERTKDYKAMTLQVAISYGSRAEITEAVKLIAKDVEAGTLDADAISPEDISSRLDTAGIPDPDLIIRTSGEHRLSNFLMWQAAYAEFLFLDVLWPDFDKAALIDAIETYKKRDRRYGGRP